MAEDRNAELSFRLVFPHLPSLENVLGKATAKSVRIAYYIGKIHGQKKRKNYQPPLSTSRQVYAEQAQRESEAYARGYRMGIEAERFDRGRG